jgi:uncharacterized membrane protein
MAYMTFDKRGVGNVIAPWRFLLFVISSAAAAAVMCPFIGLTRGVMSAFDIGAIAFLAACAPLFDDTVTEMRQVAVKNDANRGVLLLITMAVTVAILASVASELAQKSRPHPTELIFIILTLCLCWIFSNLVYALHYAHLFYMPDNTTGKDAGGLRFPGTEEPDYWDFAYYASCLGMTFQTSDVEIHSKLLRRASMFHCLLAFVFNLGVIAFTINILGSS